MKDGEFHPTEDAVVIGFAKGTDAGEALRNLKKECPHLKSYRLQRVAVRVAGDAVYL